MSSDYCVALPGSATGLSAVFDCGIFLSYYFRLSIPFIWLNMCLTLDARLLVRHFLEMAKLVYKLIKLTKLQLKISH